MPSTDLIYSMAGWPPNSHSLDIPPELAVRHAAVDEQCVPGENLLLAGDEWGTNLNNNYGDSNDVLFSMQCVTQPSWNALSDSSRTSTFQKTCVRF